MSALMSFATGFLNGSVQVQREKAAKEIADKEAKALTQKEAVDRFAGLNFKDTPKEVALLFGKQAFGPDFTLADVGNMFNDVDSTIFYGDFSTAKPDKWNEDLRADNPLRAGDTWLGTWNRVLSDPKAASEFATTLSGDENARTLFLGDVMKYSDYYVTGQRIRPGREDIQANYSTAQDTFTPLFDFLNKNGLMPDVNKTMTIASNQSLISKEAKVGNIDKPENAFVVSFYTGEGTKTDGVLEFTDDEDLKAINRISMNLGYSDSQAFVSDYQRVGVAKTPEGAYKNLLSAIEMERKGFGTLASGTLAGSEQLRTNFVNYIEEEFGGDMRAAVTAYAPLIMIKEDKDAAKRSYMRKRQVELANPEDYFTRNKLNKSQIMLQYEASTNTLLKLQQLSGLLDQEETPTGLKAKVQSLGFGIFGEGGQIDQFFGSEQDSNGAYEQGTNAETLKRVAMDIGFLSPETAANLSVMDSLKLSLAAEMARAVDPSGRLSNQDFEIQLRRLGDVGWFSGKVTAQASLQTVTEDFERSRRRLEVLNEVALAPEFTRREARILRADQLIRSAQDANYNIKFQAGSQTGSQTGQQEQAPAVTTTPSRMTTPDGGATFRGSDGRYYLDAEGTQPVNARTLVDPNVAKAS